MQIHKSEFKPLRIDNSFSIKVIDKFEDGEEHFKAFVSSIDTNLSDWDGRPTITNVESRLNGVSKCTLFYTGFINIFFVICFTFKISIFK